MSDNEPDGGEPGIVRIREDPDAFEAFYRENIGTVQRFIARRTEDPHLAADLAADVFLAAIDAAESYRADRGTPAGWLLGLARNVVGTELRRQRRHREAVRRISGRRLLDQEALQRIDQLLDGLPAKVKATFLLSQIDGLTYPEIARTLGISQRSVSDYMAKALQRCLKASLS